MNGLKAVVDIAVATDLVAWIPGWYHVSHGAKGTSRRLHPFFVTERKRSEAALIQVIQEAFVQGVSTRKMEKLAKSLGIESLSRSQVSEMTKGLNEQVNAFRSRSLSQSSYPILWVDALYEKVRMDGRIVSMAILVVCGVDEHGQRDILAIEPLLEESEEVYLQLFRGLQERGLCTPRLVVSDAHAGLVAAIRKGFPGASWQRCKVHFMRIFWHIFLIKTKMPLPRSKDDLVGLHQRTGPQAGRRNLPTVRTPFSQSHPLLEDV